MGGNATRDSLPQGKTKGGASRPSANGSNGHADGASARAEATAAEERDKAGRFAPGNKGGPGNPFARQVAARRKALLDAISPEDVAAVGKELLSRSLAGDVAAAKVLLAYVVGNPGPMVDPDNLDLQELQVLFRRPFRSQLCLHALEGVDPAAALDFLDGPPPTREKIIAAADGAGLAALALLKAKVMAARARQT
jgi:hypothetical protein